MIDYTDVRVKDGLAYPSTPQELKPGKAFSRLVDCELAFGGKVVECTPTRVSTCTTVMGCVDTTTFSGSEQDMRYLYEVAKNVTNMRAINHLYERQPDDGTRADIHRLHRALKEGGGAVRGAMLHMLGNDDAAFVARVICHSVKDLTAALALLADGEATMAEVHQLLT